MEEIRICISDPDQWQKSILLVFRSMLEHNKVERGNLSLLERVKPYIR